MGCFARHTKYQPTDDEWRCPICGATSEQGFVVYEPDENESEDCEQLHAADLLFCDKCSHSETGKVFSERIVKLRGLTKCLCCNGTGLIKKED